MASLCARVVRWLPLLCLGVLVCLAWNAKAMREPAGMDRPAREVAEARPGGGPGDLGTPGSIAMLARCLMALGANGNSQKLTEPVRQQILAAQWDESRGLTRDDAFYGGVGMQRDAPPDLQHTALAVDALCAAGLPAGSAAIQKALLFVGRCQRGPSANAAEQGGFAATTVGSGRPSGLLTCAGLKACIAAGLAADDRRVKAALAWLGQHYTLEVNPGATPPRRQLYEFYFELARTMTALGAEHLVDAAGTGRDWRGDLTRVLLASQQSDGSWLNPDESLDARESSRFATTCYAVMTLKLLHPESPGDGAPEFFAGPIVRAGGDLYLQ